MTATRLLGELLTVTRFGIVGAVATLVHLSCARLLVARAGWDPYLANLTAFGCAFVVSFVGQYRWTFRSRRRPGSAFRRFLGVSVGAFLLSTLGLYLLLRVTAQPAPAAVSLAALSIPVFTYLLNRLWVFRA